MFKFWKKKETGREKTKVYKEECGRLTKNTIEISGVSEKAGKVIESVIRNMESGKVKKTRTGLYILIWGIYAPAEVPG